MKEPASARLHWPLNMKNNIARSDLDAVIEFLRQEDPHLIQSVQKCARSRRNGPNGSVSVRSCLCKLRILDANASWLRYGNIAWNSVAACPAEAANSRSLI